MIMKKEMGKDLQKAMEYVVYMMVGSYFRKTECESRWMEDTLHIEYLETKEKTQDMMEKQCIYFVEKVLRKKLPKQVWNEKMEVRFVSFPDGSSEVRFQGAYYMLRVFVQYKGKKTEFQHTLLKWSESH